MGIFNFFKRKNNSSAEGKPVGSETAQKEPAYFEKDNIGTRQETMQQAISYWMGERQGSSVKPPFTLFTFSVASEAEAALLCTVR